MNPGDTMKKYLKSALDLKHEGFIFATAGFFICFWHGFIH